MAELTTKTGSDVATEVKREFGDEDGVQITDADIIKWINSTQRKITQVNPILQMRVTHDLTAGQQQYEYAADRIQYIQSISYKGVPLEGLSYQEAQEYILKHNAGNNTGQQPLIWWQWAQSIFFWPIPEVTEADALTMDFVAIPEDLTAIGDTLSVPDRYFDTIVEGVMLRAHLLDENWDAAGFSKGQLNESLGLLSEQENKIRIATYPTISVRYEDSW